MPSWCPERGEQVSRRDWAREDLAAVAVGLAEHEATFQAAASHDTIKLKKDA